jgi:hypothetical protein
MRDMGPMGRPDKKMETNPRFTLRRIAIYLDREHACGCLNRRGAAKTTTRVKIGADSCAFLSGSSKGLEFRRAGRGYQRRG